MKQIFPLLLTFLHLQAACFECSFDRADQVWSEVGVEPFNQLIVGFEGKRPVEGEYLIQVRLLRDEWSEWLSYAYWGADGQRSCRDQTASERVFQDEIEVLSEHKAVGFGVRVIPSDGLQGGRIRWLNAIAIDTATHALDLEFSADRSFECSVPKLSQMQIDHPRAHQVCAPTATAALIGFFGPGEQPPLPILDQVYDSTYDIYGNWVFNMAAAADQLGEQFRCRVAKFTSFRPIYQRLSQGLPTVVSVKGPLVGSALPYRSGHLLCVRGYDAITDEVLCMDPAFPEAAATECRYPIEAFLQAWSRREGVAFVIDKGLSGI